MVFKRINARLEHGTPLRSQEDLQTSIPTNIKRNPMAALTSVQVPQLDCIVWLPSVTEEIRPARRGPPPQRGCDSHQLTGHSHSEKRSRPFPHRLPCRRAHLLNAT